jgi:hypothetical protein
MKKVYFETLFSGLIPVDSKTIRTHQGVPLLGVSTVEFSATVAKTVGAYEKGDTVSGPASSFVHRVGTTGCGFITVRNVGFSALQYMAGGAP